MATKQKPEGRRTKVAEHQESNRACYVAGGLSGVLWGATRRSGKKEREEQWQKLVLCSFAKKKKGRIKPSATSLLKRGGVPRKADKKRWQKHIAIAP